MQLTIKLIQLNLQCKRLHWKM